MYVVVLFRIKVHFILCTIKLDNPFNMETLSLMTFPKKQEDFGDNIGIN